jgi:hypothetical protein
MKQLWTLAIALLAAAGAPLEAQYPNVDKTVTLAPGDSIRLLSRIVQDVSMSRPPGRRLDLTYSTWIPSHEVAQRKAQADRAAEFFGPQAVEIGARRLSIGICDTRACAERKDPPAEWFLYERTSRGWTRAP